MRNTGLSSTHTRLIPRQLHAEEHEADSIGHLYMGKNKRAHGVASERIVVKNAKVLFYNKYRNIHRLQPLTTTEPSPALAMLKSFEKERLTPLPLGLIKTQGTDDHISLNFALSNRYANSFSQGLKQVRSLEKIELKGNKLSPAGSLSILNSIASATLRSLDVSGNRIGTDGIRRIVQLITAPQSVLQTVNLEQCGITDANVQVLCEALKMRSSAVSELTLAKNGLRDGKALGELLEVNRSLKSLDLHWNMIYQQGARALFEGLELNTGLTQLDLSWNGLGTNAAEMVGAMSEALANNTTLQHLDISFNSLNKPECEALAEALTGNHTLKGLHVLGNACSVDSTGFLVVSDSSQMNMHPHSDRRMLVKQKQRLGENCWVCEQWTEDSVCFPTYSEGPYFACLDCDTYRPLLLTKHTGIHTYKRALPPQPLQLFFIDLNGQVLLNDTMPKKQLRQPMSLELNITPTLQVSVIVNEVNVLEPEPGRKLRESQPRAAWPEYLPPAVEVVRAMWDFNNSIFKGYELDTPALITQCFEFDWEHAKISKLFNDEQDLTSCRELLRANYSQIKDLYKSLSAVSFGEYFSVSQNVFFDLLGSQGLFAAGYGASDLGINWKSVIVPKIKNQKYNPGNSLVRYEFVELLVRVAFDKYFRKKQTTTITEAVQKVFEELQEVISSANFNEFKKQYFCEEIDTLYKDNRRLLIAVFNQFSGRKKMPDEKPFVSVEEFRELALGIGCCTEASTTREVDQAFCFAMSTRKDELFNNRHMKMSELEFYEALARLSCVLDKSDNVLVEKVRAVLPVLFNIIKVIRRKNTEHLTRVLKTQFG